MLSIVRMGVWRSIIHGPDTWIFTTALAILFPIFDVLIYRRSKSALGIYAWVVAAEWSLVAGCVWIIRQKGLRVADLGERLGNLSRALITLAVLLAVAAVVVIGSKRQTRKPSPAQLAKAVGRIKRMLPVTRRERAMFVAVALTAGFCEELLYRGWLLNLIASVVGSVWIAVIVSSILFGIAHVYQGRNGILSATVLGVVFGIVFIASGGLLLGQVLHTAIDLKNGFAMAKIAARSKDSCCT